MNIKLSKPFAFEGKEYTELELNLEALTGKDMINAEAEAKTISIIGSVAEFSKAYLAVLAAKAAKVPVDLIMGLSGKDFSRMTVEVQNFLFE